MALLSQNMYALNSDTSSFIKCIKPELKTKINVNRFKEAFNALLFSKRQVICTKQIKRETTELNDIIHQTDQISAEYYTQTPKYIHSSDQPTEAPQKYTTFWNTKEIIENSERFGKELYFLSDLNPIKYKIDSKQVSSNYTSNSLLNNPLPNN